MQTKKKNEKSKSTSRKSDSSINTDQSPKTPQINDEQHKAKKPESGKHKSKSKEVKGVVKDTDGLPVKLTKKQRAKKAAVIRMMKFKS
jgi:hypothetical protein